MEEDPLRLRVVVRAPRLQPFMTLIGVWLLAWAGGEVVAIRRLVASLSEPEPQLFLVYWLTGWTIAGAFFLHVWLWMAAGREIVEVHPGGLDLRRDVLGIGSTQRFGLHEVHHVRILPPPEGRGETGGVAFERGEETCQFGPGLPRAEADEIVRALAGRLRRGLAQGVHAVIPEKHPGTVIGS